VGGRVPEETPCGRKLAERLLSLVLKTIARGHSNKAIGHKFGITEGTVKVYVKNLLHKLDLRSRVEAAVWAMEHMR
jgi:two-component system nitrate/nitrite response regulator NarL